MEKLIKKNNLYYPNNFVKKNAWMNDNSVYKKAMKNPVKFWETQAKELFWFKKWKNVFIHSPPTFKWFVGGKINLSYNCLERNLVSRKNKVALIWEPEPTTESRRVLTYYELYKEVNKAANGLKKLGVKRGEVVAIYLPMIPEAIISMLACTRIGAPHIVIFSAFSPSALKLRLNVTKAKFLITADGYWRKGKIIKLKEKADEGIKGTKVKKTVVVRRLKSKLSSNKKNEIQWDNLISNQEEICEPQKMDSEDTLFILPESGTGGEFIPIKHTCGGYSVQAHTTGKWIWDFKDIDIYWCSGDIGWITGHTYAVYSPLLNGATSVIYEGALNYPNEERWAKIIENNGVTIFYTAPTAVRMFERSLGEKIKNYGFETLRILGSVGEPIDEATWKWYLKEIGKEKCPLLDTWWQTETGGIVITSLPGIGPFKPTFTGRTFPGIRTEILDEKGRPCKKFEEGNLVILPPFCPGMMRDVYGNRKTYQKTYFGKYNKRIYFTSDLSYKDENGLIRIVGRADDIINVAGHRMSTGELENIIDLEKNVSEVAVIGIPHSIKGAVPLVFAVLKSAKKEKEMNSKINSRIEKEWGKLAIPEKIYFVEELPKTRSGKIMRGVLKHLYMKEDLGDLSSLANTESVNKIKNILAKK